MLSFAVLKQKAGKMGNIKLNDPYCGFVSCFYLTSRDHKVQDAGFLALPFLTAMS